MCLKIMWSVSRTRKRRPLAESLMDGVVID